MRTKHFLSALILLVTLFTASSFAGPGGPKSELQCLDDAGKPLPVMNEQVLKYKTTTANQFLARGRVSGVIRNIYPIKNGHYHFQAVIGPKASDTIEVIYNIAFGQINNIVPGLPVEACGDYITSIAPTNTYEPSPDGAIIHWVHRSPDQGRHKSGYVIINNIVYGQGAGAH
jgi:hypothetical protein